MKKQNKDGKPIYSDDVWNQMLGVGEKLENLGSQESVKKQNLCYKQLKYEITEKAIDSHESKGIMFVDMRGTDIVPIWDDPRPITYSKELPFRNYMIEFIRLVRAGCSPRLTFFQSSEPDGWAFGLDIIPDGYCKGCGVDIIKSVKWDILEEDINDLLAEGLDPNI
ncbi:MAG: hypothetical protein ACFFG0_45915 [Candidatus Thorarchaeota archaeon]